MTNGPLRRGSPRPAVVPEPGSTPDKPSRVVDGSPRAPRGLIIGALIATPLWAGLLLLARHLYASLR